MYNEQYGDYVKARFGSLVPVLGFGSFWGKARECVVKVLLQSGMGAVMCPVNNYYMESWVA